MPLFMNKKKEINNPIDYLMKVDKRLSKVIKKIGEIDSISNDLVISPFQFLVGEIVGQMISSKVRQVLFNRLIEICNNNIEPEVINNLTIEDLRSIGLSYSKSEYIKNLSALSVDKLIDLNSLYELTDEEVIEYLTAIKGIGKWTSKMFLLFYLKRPDILPYEDGAFLQSYKWLYNTKNIEKDKVCTRCKKWSPFSSLASKYLYRALDTGLTKISIKDFLKQ